MIDYCCTLETTTRTSSSSSSEVSMSSPLLIDSSTVEDDPIAKVTSSSSSQEIKEDEKKEETNNKKKLPFLHVLTQDSTEELIIYQEIKFEEQYSRILLPAPVPSELPSYEWKDISIDTVLGQGSFSFVFQVSASTTTAACTTTTTTKETKKAALKCLKASSISNEDEFICNAQDLYSESNLLERLNHPHIIKLLGTCQLGLVESFKQTDGYFVMLEIMNDTLQERLNTWRNAMEHDHDDSSQRIMVSKPQIISRLQSIAMPVLDAMEYLHSNHIVLRDLKPENIGFDQNGCVKLFDFGLARGEHLLKHETDMAGSILYMAPEVLQLQQNKPSAGKPISFPSDVYSFAIVIWELCTLDIPLRKYTTLDEVVTNVGGSKKYRPSLSGIPSSKIKTLLSNTWKHNPDDRPTFNQLRRPLETILKIDSSSSENTTSGGSVPKRTRSSVGVGNGYGNNGRSTTPKRKLSNIKLGFKSTKSALF